MSKPRIFIGSSTEGLAVARAIQSNLCDVSRSKVWKYGAFGLSKTYIEALEEQLEKSDFAIFVLTADDIFLSRDNQFDYPRDNVLFEVGLFIGKIGRDRTYLVCEDKEGLKIPTDLSGLSMARYQPSDEIDEDEQDWVGPGCNQIRNAMKSANLIEKRTPRLSDKSPESMSFENLIKEYHDTLERLESENAKLLNHINETGDMKRLLNGLYGGMLFCSRALVTGYVDSLLYGNLMEWDKDKRLLRVCYFEGPYNEEIITREFPVEYRGQGVASIAFKTREIQIRNSMDNELMEPGEARLKSMMSIPIETVDGCPDGAVAILNVDCAIVMAFAEPQSKQRNKIEKRALALADQLKRTNRLESFLRAS